jgi:hypothetical protein
VPKKLLCFLKRKANGINKCPILGLIFIAGLELFNAIFLLKNHHQYVRNIRSTQRAYGGDDNIYAYNGEIWWKNVKNAVCVCEPASPLLPLPKGAFFSYLSISVVSSQRPKYVYKFIAVTVFPFLLRKFIIIIFSLLRIFPFTCVMLLIFLIRSRYILFFSFAFHIAFHFLRIINCRSILGHANESAFVVAKMGDKRTKASLERLVICGRGESGNSFGLMEV